MIAHRADIADIQTKKTRTKNSWKPGHDEGDITFLTSVLTSQKDIRVASFMGFGMAQEILK